MSTIRSALGDYLRARRDALNPETVGIATYTRRRVAGLRRDEVASLAGISQEYYLRLEQGRDRTPSDQVLEALSRALRLEQAGRDHLFRVAAAQPEDLLAREQAVPMQNLTAIVKTWPSTPAYIIDSRHTVVVSNPMARAVVPSALEVGTNIPEFVYTNAAVRALPTWEALAERTVGRLRFYGHPYDERLLALGSRLAAADEHFRVRWNRHDVDAYYDGDVKPYVQGYGQIPLHHQTLVVPGTPGYLLCAYHAEPGSDSERALAALAAQLPEPAAV